MFADDPKALHRPSRGRFQQFLKFMLVDLRVAGGGMAAGLVAGQDQMQLAFLAVPALGIFCRGVWETSHIHK
jgi:hypothetical protein